MGESNLASRHDLEGLIALESEPTRVDRVDAPNPEAPKNRHDPEDLPPGTVVGEYVVEGKLGQGAMGRVYSALHPKIGKRAAVKVIGRQLCASPEAIERFIQEARAVNRIQDANIVDIFSFGELPDGRGYLIMELLEGETLADRLLTGALPLGEAAVMLGQICRALEATHETGVVHRDLKPANVFLKRVRGDRPQVKLLDFGIAKLIGENDLRVRRTMDGVTLGTPMYMSPEQAQTSDVDGRTDVYSLGVMAYEMVLGRPPFSEESAVGLLMQHVNRPPPPPCELWPEVPPALGRLLLQLLEKDPARRPTLPQLRAQLAAWEASPLRCTQVVASLPAARAAWPTRAAPAVRARGGRLAVLGGMVGGLACGALAWLVLSHPDASRAASQTGSVAAASASLWTQAPGGAPLSAATGAVTPPPTALPGPANAMASGANAMASGANATASPANPAAGATARALRQRAAAHPAAVHRSPKMSSPDDLIDPRLVPKRGR